jgi:ribosomal protein S27AE
MRDIYIKENIEKIVKESKSTKECLIKLGRPTTGDNYNFLKRKLIKYQIDTSHFYTTKELQKIAIEKRGGVWFSTRFNLEEILVENSPYTGSGNNIKEKLYKAGLKKRECEECGQGEIWKEKKISLHLEHINGIHNDHRIENLKILCPNCHATTDTYAGKNRKSYKLKLLESKEDKNKIEKEKKIEKIKNSGVLFDKWGWPIRLGQYLNCSPQYALKWVKENMSDFYLTCKH